MPYNELRQGIIDRLYKEVGEAMVSAAEAERLGWTDIANRENEKANRKVELIVKLENAQK